MNRENPFNLEPEALKAKAKDVRKIIIEMIEHAGSGHPGGSLSATDLGVALFFNEMAYKPNEHLWSERDRFVLSKGHCAPLLYGLFAETGQIDPELVWSFSKQGSLLQKHGERHLLDCIEVSTGSLGQGISMAVGMALSAKQSQSPSRIYAMIGGGECNEGQVWEALMAAAHFKLDNLCIILDHNKLQTDGSHEQVMGMEPIEKKFESFGLNVIELDGHDYPAILAAFETAKNTKGIPTIFVAHTTKGKGVSFMEGEAKWHARSITEEEKNIALKDLENDF